MLVLEFLYILSEMPVKALPVGTLSQLIYLKYKSMEQTWSHQQQDTQVD